MTQHTHPRRLGAATPRQQQGAALIVTVLLMLVISLLGLTAMMRNNLDERMAFNQRDRQIALQAAESALREAEGGIDARFGALMDDVFLADRGDCEEDITANEEKKRSAGWCKSPPSSSNGRWATVGADKREAWLASTLPVTLHATTDNLSAPPRYLIVYEGNGLVGSPEPGTPCVPRFLITAWATGLNANSSVVLQSQFRRRFGNCQTLI